MKTTNNKLLDNTGNPVSHNRPTIKLVEWEVRTKSDFLLWNSPDDTAIWDGERTGNTREVERPMYDTEYIEYLENKIESNGLSAAKTAMAQCDRIDELWNENQELKVLLTNTALKDISRIAEIQEQYLKAVESVIQNQIEQAQNPTMMVMLNWMKEHLLQEIKSAMEKEGE